MELKGCIFISKEPHVALEPQVADPWPNGSRLSDPKLGFHSYYGN